MTEAAVVRDARVQCPAKINLFLEVTGRRKDGYHRLATIFAKIGLFDVLEIESLPPGPVELIVENGATATDASAEPDAREWLRHKAATVPAGPENIVVKAAESFRKEFGIDCGARIRLQKNIPVGAGLGGGSSDAAGTLLGLSRVFGVGSVRRAHGVRQKLARLAARLGADVPFFLREAPFCLGCGVGDRLSALRVPMALPWLVLVYPESAVSTAEIYGRLSLPERKSVLTRLAHLDKLKKKLGNGRPISEWAGLLFNRLEDVALPAHPEISQAKRALTQLGARGVLMSGSGSSVFGFVSSREEGEAVRKKLQGYPWRVYVTCCTG